MSHVFRSFESGDESYRWFAYNCKFIDTCNRLSNVPTTTKSRKQNDKRGNFTYLWACNDFNCFARPAGKITLNTFTITDKIFGNMLQNWSVNSS